MYSSTFNLILHQNKYNKLYLLNEKAYLKDFSNFDKDFFYNKSYLSLISNPFSNIDQIVVSESLKIFEKKIKKNFLLKEYYDSTKPCLFFGIYNLDDIRKINRHKGEISIIWGGSDINNISRIIFNTIQGMQIKHHYAISNDRKE